MAKKPTPTASKSTPAPKKPRVDKDVASPRNMIGEGVSGVSLDAVVISDKPKPIGT